MPDGQKELGNPIDRDFVRCFRHARMVDQNLPHRARRYAKEVIFVEDARFQPAQFQEQLADQRGGLQGVSGAFPAK